MLGQRAKNPVSGRRWQSLRKQSIKLVMYSRACKGREQNSLRRPSPGKQTRLSDERSTDEEDDHSRDDRWEYLSQLGGRDEGHSHLEERAKHGCR